MKCCLRALDTTFRIVECCRAGIKALAILLEVWREWLYVFDAVHQVWDDLTNFFYPLAYCGFIIIFFTPFFLLWLVIVISLLEVGALGWRGVPEHEVKWISEASIPKNKIGR